MLVAQSTAKESAPPETGGVMVEMVGRGLAWMRMRGKLGKREVTRYLRSLSLRLAREDLGHPRLLVDFSGVHPGVFAAWSLVRGWVRDFPGLMDIRVAAAPFWVRLAVYWHKRLLTPGRSLEIIADPRAVLVEELGVRNCDHEENGICVFTGLPLVSRFSWLRQNLGPEATIGFRVVGDCILVGRPEGNLQWYDLDKYFALRERVIQESPLKGRNFVEIRDYAATWGMRSEEERQEYYRRMSMENNRIRGLVLCHINSQLQDSINNLPISDFDRKRLRVCDNLAEALRYAHRLGVHNGLAT